MIVEAIKRSLIGIGIGGFVTFVVLTIINFNDVEASVSQIWLSMLCSYIIGIYFGLASFIFEDNNDWSQLKRTVIHFFLSIVVYFIVALSAEWVPLSLKAILISSIIFIFIYAVFWIGYYLYYKRVEARMNADLHNKEK